MRIKLYRDESGQYRIGLYCVGNYEPMFASTESYTRRTAAKTALRKLYKSMRAGTLTLYDEERDATYTGEREIIKFLTPVQRAARSNV